MISSHRTIGRNRPKLLEAIFAGAIEAKAYTLENAFSGQPVPIDYVRRKYEQSGRARMISLGAGKFVVRLHSNQWYEIISAAEGG